MLAWEQVCVCVCVELLLQRLFMNQLDFYSLAGSRSHSAREGHSTMFIVIAQLTILMMRGVLTSRGNMII